MENGSVRMDSIHEFHADPVSAQLPAGFEGNFEIQASSSEVAEPILKVLKAQVLADESNAPAIVNGGQQSDQSTSAPTIENGKEAPTAPSAEATEHKTDEAEAAEEGEEFDAEGYRVEERRETETLSHTEEITEKPERTELRTREIKEVTMEELKTKETVRPVSLEELKAILEKEFDRTGDEVEIGRNIVIEEFSRVESEREEFSGGKVTVSTFSVKEEHRTREIKEQIQLDGAEGSGFEEEAGRRVDEVIENMEEFQEVKAPSSETQQEEFEGDGAAKLEDVAVKSEQVAAKSEEVAALSEEVAAMSEVVAALSEEVAAKSDEIDAKSEEVAAKLEQSIQQSENSVPQRAEESTVLADTEKEKVAEEHKGEKEKGSKSRDIIKYIKVKARSLSRDRGHNKAAALAAASAAAEESGEPSKEVSQSKDGSKSPAKKTKQKKWKLFGKKSAGEQDDSSSEASANEDDATADKRVKLVAFTKRSEEQGKEEGEKVAPTENVAKDDRKSTKEEGKQGRTKVGFIKKGKQKKEVDQRSAEDDTKPKEGKSEPQEEVIIQQEAEKNEQTEGSARKAKDHKWFHFGKKTDKESPSPELEDKTDAVEVKVPENEAPEVVQSTSQEADQSPEVHAGDGSKTPENLATSSEPKGEGQEKVTKEHKKFSFGQIFGKKKAKSTEKSEHKPNKENDAIESSKAEGEKSDTNDKVPEIVVSEAQISVDDAQKADEEITASHELPLSENIEEGSSSVLTNERQPDEVVEETNEEHVAVSITDQVPNDQVVDAHRDEVEVAEIVPEKQPPGGVEEDEGLEIGPDDGTNVDGQIDGAVVEAGQPNEVPEIQQNETVDSEEKLVSVSVVATEPALDSLEGSDSKQQDRDVITDDAEQRIENAKVVELVQEGSAEQSASEHINSNAQTPEQTTAVEVSTEAQTVENDVEETQTTEGALKKEQKQTKKFSFGLKKKDGSKVEDDAQKHKVWSPFSKKPAKKEKEGQAAAEAERDPQVPAEPKTPDSSADVEQTEEGTKVEIPEPKQSESREGTLKRNKGIHKLFNFGKKSRSVEDKAGSSESKAAASETNGDTEAAALDKSMDGGASAEKGASEAAEEGKHHQKKFSFGLNFGKKRDKDVGSGDGSKQQRTPTEDLAVVEGGTKDSTPAVPAATEPKILEEQTALHITQTEAEATTGKLAIDAEIAEPSVSRPEGTGVIVPEVYQIVVSGGRQAESAVGREVLTDEGNESALRPMEVTSPEVKVKESEKQSGSQEESANIAGKIEADEKLPTTDIEVRIETTETVDAANAQNVTTSSSLEFPTPEFDGNAVFEQRNDSAVVSENEEELIPKTEVKLLEESGVDLEADKPTLEFDDVNKIVDDIMNSDVKLSENWLNGETNDLKIDTTEEVAAVVVTETSSALLGAEALPKTHIETAAEEQKTEHQSIEVKLGDVEEKVEPAETKSEGLSESAKEPKQKKPLFGIKFGKKSKQTASKEKIEEHEQNGATEANGKNVERTESDLSSEADKSDGGRREEKSKEPKNIEELIIEVEVREEKDESKIEDADDKQCQSGLKWLNFGKKADKKKEVKENGGEHASSRSDEAEITTVEADSASKQPKGSAKKSSHGLGKGFLKIFTPKKQLRFGKSGDDHSKTNGDQQEPIVVYSIESEGQVVAETHWRPKQESEPATRDIKPSEETPKGLSIEESSAATNGKASKEEVEDTTDATATLNGSAHDSEVPVVKVSQSACAQAPPPSNGTSPGHFVVVAIDFGTTFSGYAFSFINSPDSIHMMRKWEGGDPGVVNQKTPTTILLTPDGSFHSFGFTARDFYHDLDAAEAGKWMYFEKFKMTLHHNTELNQDTTVTGSNGKEFPAMRLFSYALRFFKDHALKELTSQSSITIDNDDVRWVITVPAIWKAPAKQFMRQAAYQAGIASPSSPDRLLIALEPEAASIYVRKLRMSQLVPIRALSSLHATPRKDTPSPNPPHDELDQSSTAIDSEHLSDHLKAGTRYMVVDCGGGTVDITVHELETDRGCLKELYKATGGPFGSTGVDHDFEKLLFEIFGSEFIETFKQKRPAGWVDLMIAFESRKRAANPHKDNPLNVSLPFSFIDFYKKQYGNQVDNAIKRFGGDKGVSWSLQGMLRLTPEAMQGLFQSTLHSITSAISDVLSNPAVKGIEYLFLVGGFSESPMLQHELRTAFEDKVRMIIPQDVSLTILKGAVCFGLDPSVITVRQSRMTYGVGVVNRFDPSRHPDSKRIQKDGTDWCAGIFDTFVASGQPVTLGDRVVRRYAPANRDQKTSIIHVYCSESSDVQYVTDPGVERCATMRLDLGDPAAPETDTGAEVGKGRREIEAMMTFGDTEIRVSARDATTGSNVGSTIDFLNK